jgi:putative FmdB family regulatory protein
VPIFEYRCRACDHPFEAIQLGRRRPACPACGGRALERRLSTFAVGGAGRGSGAPAPGACGTCGDPRGPGACAAGEPAERPVFR